MPTKTYLMLRSDPAKPERVSMHAHSAPLPSLFALPPYVDGSDGSILGGRQVLGADEIVELGGLRLEMQPDRTDRAMPLLGDNHIGHALGGFVALLPPLVAVVELVFALLRAAGRLA